MHVPCAAAVAVRIIISIEAKEAAKDSERLGLIAAYKSKVEEELKTICHDILTLLDESLLTKAGPA